MELLELRTMELVVLTGAIRGAKLQSNRRYQQTNTQLRGRIPSCRSTNSVRALKGKKYHIPQTCSPQAHLGSSNLVLWPLKAPDYFGRGPPSPSSALWCQYSTLLLPLLVPLPLLLLLRQAVGGRPPWYTPPLSSRGRRSASRGRADGNVAAVSHGQHVPTPTAAAAWRASTAVSKAAWWPWPLTF